MSELEQVRLLLRSINNEIQIAEFMDDERHLEALYHQRQRLERRVTEEEYLHEQEQRERQFADWDQESPDEIEAQYEQHLAQQREKEKTYPAGAG